MATFTIGNNYPRVNDIVEGKSGKKTFTGRVMENPEKRNRPWVFRSRYSGAVLCYIDIGNGVKKAVNEIKLIKGGNLQ